MTNANDQFLKMIIDAMDKLQAEKKVIDNKIASLELTYETLVGHKPDPKAVARKPRAARVRGSRPGRKSDRRLDPKAIARTLAFLQERKRAVTIDVVAGKFGITREAALQRLIKLVKLGNVERVGGDRSGRYAIAGKRGTASANGASTHANGFPAVAS